MSTWELDEEARADVIGTASARLLAAGVSRDDRKGALRLLGVLSASADERGVVRRGFPDLCAEFELDHPDASRWLEALAAIGIVRRESRALVLAGVEPPATGGLRLADFLANAEVAAEPLPVAPPARRTRTGHVLVAAAAVVVALVAVPLLGRPPAQTGFVRATADRGTTGAEAAADDRSVTRSPWRRLGWGSPPDRSSDVARRPASDPTTSTTVVHECPAGEPLLEVIGIADGTAPGVAAVEALIRNPTHIEVHVDGFTVVAAIGEHRVELAGLDRPLTIPPGQSIRWTVQTPMPGVPELTATVVLDQWRWADEATQRTCR